VNDFYAFEALDEIKQKKIINVSMQEFVKGGYEKASMNNLVQAAGISKGSLFYYFKNKKTLYLYLVSYTMTRVKEQTLRSSNSYDDDFINRLHISMKGNVELIDKYPLIFAFMRGFKSERSVKVCDDILKILSLYSEELFKELYKGIDKSFFKDNIEIELAIYAIKATLFQQLHEYIRSGKSDKKAVLDKLEEYAGHFRQVYYK